MASAWLPSALLLLYSSFSPSSGPSFFDLDPRVDATPFVTNLINDFGFNFFRAIRERPRDRNLLYCPLCTVSSLGMLLSGASNATAAQIAAVLGAKSVGVEWFHRGMKATVDHLVSGRLSAPTNGSLLTIRDLVLVQAGLELQPRFVERLARDYRANVTEVDFALDADIALSRVNDWVRRETRGKIDSILEHLDTDTRLLLLNAVYLNAKWSEPFDSLATDQDMFFNEDGSASRVNMMSIRETFRVGEFGSRRMRMLELPYAGNLSMLILLPTAERGVVDELMAGLSADQLDEMIGQLRPDEIGLSFPKFRLSSTLDLKSILPAMGLTMPFSDGAEFERISRTLKLKVDDAVQKSMLSVSEEGTEAAAVTAMRLVPRSGFYGPAIEVNRPFGFVIRDRSTGVHLFVGVVKKLSPVKSRSTKEISY